MATSAAKEIADLRAQVAHMHRMQKDLQSLRDAFYDFLAEWLWEEQRKEHLRAKRAQRMRSRKQKRKARKLADFECHKDH